MRPLADTETGLNAGRRKSRIADAKRLLSERIRDIGKPRLIAAVGTELVDAADPAAPDPDLKAGGLNPRRTNNELGATVGPCLIGDRGTAAGAAVIDNQSAGEL